MPAIHRIRLRGPWDIVAEHDSGTILIPSNLAEGGFPDIRGMLSFYRRFGLPTNLNAADEVWLVFEGVVGAAHATLNGTALGPIDGAAEFPVHTLLTNRNSLQVELEATDDRCGLLGEVRLEIRPRS